MCRALGLSAAKCQRCCGTFFSARCEVTFLTSFKYEANEVVQAAITSGK